MVLFSNLRGKKLQNLGKEDRIIYRVFHDLWTLLQEVIY
jgi:hypothetical protein